MGTYRNVFAATKLDYKTSFNPGSTVGSTLQRSIWIPDKISGSFLTLPNGNRFRRATNYLRIEKWLEFGVPQNTEGKLPTQVQVYGRTTPGGYNPGLILGSLSGTLGGTGSLVNFGQAPVIPTLMSNEASTKALLMISSVKAGIAEDLATFRQTIDLIRNPLSTLVSQLRRIGEGQSFKRFLSKSARDLNREGIHNVAAQEYLKYVYGWKPLMSDIYGVLALMKDRGSKDLLLFGEGTSDQTKDTAVNVIHDISSKCDTSHGPHSDHTKVSCKIWARIDPNCTGLRALNQLGLLNPISLAWELVPYSFVVDWVLPIGPALQALTAPAGLIYVNGSISVRNRITGPYEHHWYQIDAYASTNTFSGGTVRYEGYKRSELTAWPLPGVWIAPEPFRSDRPLKALALAVTRLRGLR